MKKSLVAVFAIAAALSAGVANAEAPTASLFNDVGVSLKGGTVGFGFDVTKAVNENFKVRAGYSSYKYSTTQTEEDVTYDAKLRLAGWNLLADYHPWAGGFRVTTGVYGPKHRANGTGRYSGTGTIDINGTTYSSSDLSDVTFDAKWGGVRPYLGIGYDGFNKVKSGLFFTSDVGVIFSGSPTVRVGANCTNAALCTQVASDLAAEEAKVRDSIKGAKYLPVVQIGVGYRF
jgi:hypothetical protein